MKPTIRVRAPGLMPVWKYEATTEYDADFVDDLRQAMPARCYRWEPDGKMWLVKERGLDVFLALLQRHFGGYEIVENGSIPAPHDRASACATLGLLPSACDELVKAAFRIAAKQHHPDRGGQAADFQRVDQAYKMLVG